MTVPSSPLTPATQFFEKGDVLRCIARQGQQAAETIRLVPSHRSQWPRDTAGQANYRRVRSTCLLVCGVLLASFGDSPWMVIPLHCSPLLPPTSWLAARTDAPTVRAA